MDDGFQGGVSAEVVCEAGGCLLGIEQGFVEAGTTQIGVDEQGFQVLLCQDDCGIEGGVGFSLLGYGAHKKHDAAVFLETEHGE